MSRQKKPKIGYSSFHGKSIAFSSEQRRKIETEYGQGQLPHDLWQQIEAATSILTAFGSAARGAPQADRISKKLERLGKAARELRQEIFDQAQAPEEVEPLTPREIYEKYFHVPAPEQIPHNLFPFLEDVLGGLDKLTQSIAQELRSGREVGFSEDYSWSLWIRMLGELMKKHGLPAEARKDVDKQKRQSPFVLFVRELQQHIPPECRKFDSAAGIAQAVHRARA